MKYTLEKVANMIFLTDDTGQIWRAWDETEFTKRKFNNTVKRIEKNLNGNIVIDNRL